MILVGEVSSPDPITDGIKPAFVRLTTFMIFLKSIECGH